MFEYLRGLYKRKLYKYKLFYWLKPYISICIINMMAFKWHLIKNLFYIEAFLRNYFPALSISYAGAVRLPLVSFSSAIEKGYISSRSIFSASRVNVSGIRTFPSSALFNTHNCYSFTSPKVQLLKVFNATIMGKSDFIEIDCALLHHDLIEFKRDLPPEEMHGFYFFSHKRGFAYKTPPKKNDAILNFNRAFSMIGSCSPNYVHWMTETLPKLSILNSVEYGLDHRIPMIIDAGLHQNIIESIELLNQCNRQIIYVKKGEYVSCNELYTLSPTAYAPFHFRKFNQNIKLNSDLVAYSMESINLLRSTLTNNSIVSTKFREKIFIKRSSISRNLLNSNEVEDYLRSQGFIVIEPEKLSFRDQINLFLNANIVVAQGGAALANIIFMPEGAKLVFLTISSPDVLHYYFTNLAGIVKLKCDVVACDFVLDSQPRAHSHLRLNLDLLKEAINEG